MKMPIRLLLLLACAGTFTAGAQRAQTSTVVVRAMDGVPIALSLDGRRFRQTGTELRVGHVQPGRKRLVVYRLVPHRYDGGATARIVYEGRLVVRPGEVAWVDLHTGTGNLTVRTTRPEAMAAPVLPDRTAPAPPAAPGAGNWLQPADIQAAVEAKKTDTERLRLMQEAARGKVLTAASLHTLASWLAFEDSRLSLVQALAGQVQDRSNLSTLRSLFRQAENQAAFEALL